MNDTIAAISTSLGVGAISIIRVSGPQAIKIVNNFFQGSDLTKVESHTINYGYIKEKEEIIDEVLVSIMKAPKTFTREDVVEINCHGGIMSTNKILELLLSTEIRFAEPGEFTKRAFLNGRIDLTQSEAIMDLIESKSEESRRLAINQLSGRTSHLIKDFREELKQIISNIEVNIDYPEYQDIEELTKEKLKELLPNLQEKLNNLVKESQNIRLIKDGIKTVIVGKPNVGKSSILNLFLDHDKAIVTNIPGTTRDIVEGEIYLDGILLNIIDTAGIRESNDTVESIGVKKSMEAVKDADLVILVLDSSKELDTDDYKILEQIKNKKYITVLNKNDLKQEIILNDKFKNIVSTNTNNNEGIKDLKEKIKEMFSLEELTKKDYNYLTNARQITLVKKASNSLKEAENALKQELPIDIIEVNIKESFDLLGEVIGEVYEEEILNHLFENFCVGK